LSEELKLLKFNGLILLGGYGEPLLHKDILDISNSFSFANVAIITNGDCLTKKLANSLLESGVKKILVSVYEEVEMPRLLEVQKDFETFIVLRNRYSKFKLTNRGGVLNEDCLHKKCYYPFYMVTIDANGDVMPCCQDWNRHYKIGNLWQDTFFECWTSSMMEKIRRQFIDSSMRTISPCNKCNANGMLRGESNYNLFKGDKRVV
jgi:radical SAM protein with 4Fe4S-binding SPASM domain